MSVLGGEFSYRAAMAELDNLKRSSNLLESQKQWKQEREKDDMSQAIAPVTRPWDDEDAWNDMTLYNKVGQGCRYSLNLLCCSTQLSSVGHCVTMHYYCKQLSCSLFFALTPQAVQEEVSYRAVTMARAKQVQPLSTEQAVTRLHPQQPPQALSKGQLKKGVDVYSRIAKGHGTVAPAGPTSVSTKDEMHVVQPQLSARRRTFPHVGRAEREGGANNAGGEAHSLPGANDRSANNIAEFSAGAISRPTVAFGRRVDSVAVRPTRR
jgi:hypothetical protein